MSQTSFREMIDMMEDAVQREATREELGIHDRVKKMQSYVLDTAQILRSVARNETQLNLDAMIEFRYAKSRLLVYLAYTDRLTQYFSGNKHVFTEAEMMNLFPEADFFDWRDAKNTARELYKTFREQDINLRIIPLPQRNEK